MIPLSTVAEVRDTTGPTLITRYNMFAAATSNGGSYSDNLGKQASGSFTYQVCVAGSTTSCSNTASVTIP